MDLKGEVVVVVDKHSKHVVQRRCIRVRSGWASGNWGDRKFDTSRVIEEVQVPRTRRPISRVLGTKLIGVGVVIPPSDAGR